MAAATIGLAHLSDADWIAHFGRFTSLPDNLSEPLALRYHGHQFQNYNAELGDGRGFLFAQMTDIDGRLMDLGTKGSGTTPYSRRGDGRLTLLGGVREVLATRYLQHLGVNTSRTMSLIETGEALTRNDEPSPTRSAVMVRLSHSHIRFGTFQRQAFFNATGNLEKLVEYCTTHFYPGATTPGDLLAACVVRSAEMVAGWMAAGFVHGVMNTDNMNITGESFDYGPYRFLPTLQSGFTAAYFDYNGLYAFARQPETMYWNLTQLAQSLSLITADTDLITALAGFAPAYRLALRDHVFRRLALRMGDLDKDVRFVMATFKYLEKSQAGWPQFWHDWQGGADRLSAAYKSANASLYTGVEFDDWFTQLKTFEASGDAPSTQTPASLVYEEIGELWEPINRHDDWSVFHAKLSTFSR